MFRPGPNSREALLNGPNGRAVTDLKCTSRHLEVASPFQRPEPDDDDTLPFFLAQV